MLGKSTVTGNKAFLSPWPVCDNKGEGCGERKERKKKECEGQVLSCLSWLVRILRFVLQFEHCVPSLERGRSFISFVRLFVL